MEVVVKMLNNKKRAFGEIFNLWRGRKNSQRWTIKSCKLRNG